MLNFRMSGKLSELIGITAVLMKMTSVMKRLHVDVADIDSNAPSNTDYCGVDDLVQDGSQVTETISLVINQVLYMLSTPVLPVIGTQRECNTVSPRPRALWIPFADRYPIPFHTIK